MRVNNDNLSLLASQVDRLMQEDSFAQDDIAAFGAPGECLGLVERGIARRLQALFEEAGLTPEEFLDRVSDRTSPKWVYSRGWGCFIDCLFVLFPARTGVV